VTPPARGLRESMIATAVTTSPLQGMTWGLGLDGTDAQRCMPTCGVPTLNIAVSQPTGWMCGLDIWRSADRPCIMTKGVCIVFASDLPAIERQFNCCCCCSCCCSCCYYCRCYCCSIQLTTPPLTYSIKTDANAWAVLTPTFRHAGYHEQVSGKQW